MNKAVFLDRDGVLNRNVFYHDTGAYESPRTASDLELHGEVLEALTALTAAGYQLFLVSNQPNAAKGKSTLQQLHQVHGKLESIFSASSIQFRAYYYCFHHPHGTATDLNGPCACRKPSPFFLYKAVRDHAIDLSASWLVGDRSTDIACGAAAGVRTVRVLPDHPHKDVLGDLPAPTCLAKNLNEAAQRILSS